MHIYMNMASSTEREPKYTQYKLEYDQVAAEHDGYCSDAEIEWTTAPGPVLFVPIEPEQLGLDEEDPDVPVTPQLMARYPPPQPPPHPSHSGSGYCLVYAPPPPPPFRHILTCNVPYYVLTRCTRV